MATIITICGTDRSGSTMLDLILGNAPDAFSCGEVSAWFRPYRKHHLKIVCPCRTDPCPVWNKIKDGPESQFHARVVKELGVNFVIDSSKDICWVIDVQKWAQQNNLRVHNILIWKDPIELAYSYWKRGRDIIYWRKHFIGYYQKLIQIEMPFFAVNYREFVEDPPRKIQDICKAIEMPYFKGKERFWEKQHHHLFGSAGIHRQLAKGESLIQSRKLYHPDFSSQITVLQKRIESDREIQNILEILRREDVKFIQNNNPTMPQKKYPLWYYGKKVQRKIRRYFMEDYDTSIFEDIETIPKI